MYLNQWAGQAREQRASPFGSGAPVNGTTEVKTVTITGTPTGGTFKLEYKGQRTAAIAFDATAAAVVAALVLLPGIGTGGVTGGGGPLPGTPVTITGALTLTFRDLPTISVVESALTGGTAPAVAVTTTTPGVDGTLRDAPIGTSYTDIVTGKKYVKTAVSTWTVVGTQT